jgi:hypothetical protein
MVLTAVVPHEAIAGFAHRVLQCSGCGVTERRLVFGIQPDAVAGSGDTEVPSVPANDPPPPAASPAMEPVISPEPRQDECSQPKPILAAPAWTRAVEKLRSRQADLCARVDEAKKADSAAQFKLAWEKLAPPVRERGATNAAIPGRDVEWSRKALRAEMRKLTRRPAAPNVEPEPRPDPQALQRFNQLWENLVPSSNILAVAPETPLSSALPAPLPRSVSLVAVEAFDTLETLQAMNAATRAILLLRGLLRGLAGRRA